MKKSSKLLQAVKKACGIIIKQGEDGFACQIPRAQGAIYELQVIVSWGKRWDHISVHGTMNGEQFTPFWEDMAYIKHLFFKPSETVVQYHPKSDVYINCHKNVLHLWRPQDKEIELPPIWMV